MVTNQRIKKRREELGLSLADVARPVGVNKSTVQRWESGGMNAGQDKLAKLAVALHTTPEYLLGWTDDPDVQIETELAAATADLTQDERKAVLNYIAFIKSQRGAKE